MRFILLSYKSSLINLLGSPCAISLWTLRFMFLKYNIFYALWCLCLHQTIMYTFFFPFIFLLFRINMSQFFMRMLLNSLSVCLCLSVSWQMALINAYNIIKSFHPTSKKTKKTQQWLFTWLFGHLNNKWTTYQ